MSILQYPDAMNGPDLQIWTNAAFDNEESESSAAAAIKASWSTLHPDMVNRSSESFQSDYSKENLSPAFMETPVTAKSSVPIKPLQVNSTILNSQAKPLKLLFKEGLLEPFSKEGYEEEEEEEGGKERDETKIDSEIEEIENEISRLSSKLEALRIEKAERNKKTMEKRGRIIPAKFLEPKQSVKIEESIPSSTKPKLNRRGLSLGPSEIVAGAGFRRLSKIEITPVQTIQNRRKSCFWKLQDIDELRATKERGKSFSLSPKSRKTVSKTQVLPPKQAATTVSTKRAVKKEQAVLSSIQPKKLFKEGEKSVTAKKPVKPGRVVASRYNQTTVNDGRKRSLPEDDKEEGKRNDKKRMSFAGKQNGIGKESCRSRGTESRVKKKWEIPSEVAVFQGLEKEEESPLPAVGEIGEALPKIKTFRCVKESPRDSGPAKRVAELIGRRSYFCSDDEVDGSSSSSVCQALRFAEEDGVEK
ncbi:hypothetical protein PanWU01x14_001100 [Parasponia andersonii]|uniref:Uncharacterized protein n=1 Tax=Parasponia andersonii TaxID=3476 RepID=A0A2P5E4S4_PARAD|nr:hypothetical protein PanWU01x14_001100 [Parasponia andersonii]